MQRTQKRPARVIISAAKGGVCEMLIDYANPDLENIVAELEGIEAQITTMKMNYCEEKPAILYTAPVMCDYFYGLQTHLHRVIEDIHLLIMESCTKAQKSKETNTE